MPYKYNHAKRHHFKKHTYRMTNYSEYNQALKNRGRIDVWLSDDILAYLGAEHVRSFAAEKDGHVVGFCSYAIDHARKCGQVGYNAVARGEQGKGIGSIMMDFVMDRILAEGMEYAKVLVADNAEHAPARRIYEKHGFQRLTGYDEMAVKL